VDARDVLDLIWIVPALPLLGAAILLLGGKHIREPIAGYIATALVALSFVASVVMFFALREVEPRSNVSTLWSYIPAGGFQVDVGFLADPLSITFALFVTGVAALIHVYSLGYMHGDARYTRFFGYMNLFVGAMLVLVLGSSFLITFVGWEGVGVCSYLLISHWFERPAAALGGKKAFVTTRVGDFGFMLAMFLIFEQLRTLDYSALGQASTLAQGTATAIALLLFLGAVGKSAQFPLHLWLPDAMEGPTPVSALIHAATMVTAGVFIVARAHEFFERSGVAMDVVTWVGAGTALLAGTVALVQPDIKRVLAYSTISQLGYMFLALGVGAYSAAIFMVITHAFYKATLFLGAGSVIHESADHQDLRTMGGLRKYMPLTAGAFIVAWLAIAGMPPFAGFWSKDEVLAKAFSSHSYGAWAVGFVAAAVTAMYMTREVWLAFFGNERFRTPATVTTASEPSAAGALELDPVGDITHTPTVDFGDQPRLPRLEHDPHEAPRVMTTPVLILAGLAVVGGLLSLPFRGVEFLSDWLDPVFEDVTAIHTSFVGGVVLSALSIAIGLVGIVAALSLYRDGLRRPDDDPALDRLGIAGRLFGHAYYYDEAVGRLVAGPVTRLADWLDRTVDTGIIDGAVNGIGRLFRDLGGRARRVQTGLVRNYALGVFVGAVALLVFMLVRGG
jgi:NADH-quinone oxidoreductase subunit L